MPEPLSSSALTATPTGTVYQPLSPFGSAGDRLIVVVGAVESAGLNSAEMFNLNMPGITAVGFRTSPTDGWMVVVPAAMMSAPASVKVAMIASPVGAKRPNRSPASTAMSTFENVFRAPGVSDSSGETPTTV